MALRIAALVKVTVQLACLFGVGIWTARSAGSGTATSHGSLGAHVVPWFQQPTATVYPPLELEKYARIAAPLYVITLPAVAATAAMEALVSTVAPP